MNAEFLKNLIQPKNQISKICGIAWSPNNMKLAVACADRKIYLFDEQGNNREQFSTKAFSSENYEIIQILYNPESTKLAVAQSDNIIIVYRLGLNWGEEKKICNKFELDKKPTCMVWSKKNTKEIIFGLSNGNIRVALLSKGTISEILYKHSSPCISISSSLDEKYIISGHKDSSIFIYNRENSEIKKLCNHSCIPTCLAWGIDSNIFAAGNDFKVSIYNEEGKIIHNFDYSNDDEIKEFSCCSISNLGDAIAFGNSSSVYIYIYNKRDKKWDEIIKKIKNEFITALCWKPDRSTLVIGNLINSVDLYEVYLYKGIIKEMFEMSIITKDTIKIKHRQTQKFKVIKTQNSSKIKAVKITLENFFVIFRKDVLITGNLNAEKFSEIAWIKTGNEKFIFDNLNICIIFNGEFLFLIEFGKNEILFSVETKAYTQEDIEKMKDQYYNYLVSTNQLDKAAKFKESNEDLNKEENSIFKEDDPIKAADLFIQEYNESNYDKNLLEKIIKELNDLNHYEKLGELYEKIGQHENAIDAYKKAKSFPKAIELAKKNNLNCVKKIEEELANLFLDEKDYENAIIHFIEAGNYEKAITISINFLNNWKNAIELINKYQSKINPSFFVEIGNHFKKEFDFKKAEKYFIKGGEPMLAFNMYINFLKFKNKEKYNKIIEKIDKFKQFFEEIEKNNILSSGKKKQFNEEENNIITQKFIDLKILLFSIEKKNEISEESIDKRNNDEDINNIYNKVMEGNINKNELKEEVIYKLIEYGKSIDEIEKILKLCKNLIQLLNLINAEFDYLLNIYKAKKKKINIDEIIGIETNSLEEIKKIHELLLQKEKDNNYELIEFEMIIMQHINYFQNIDLKNLFIIKEMIKNHEKYLKGLNNLSININYTIKDTTFHLINQKSLSSREIIDIILNVGIKVFEFKEQEIFYSINIYDLNETDISQFYKLWDLIFGNQHLTHVLIRIIISKIQILNDFGFIFKLIPDYLFDKSTVKELEDNFRYLFYYNINIKSCKNILNDIYKILEIMVLLNYPIKNFLQFIENSNISKKNISNLYLRIIQDIKLNQNEELKNYALTYLIEKNMNSDFNSVYFILQIMGTRNNNFILNFLSIIDKFKIKEEDFYDPIMTNKFKLYITIFQNFPNCHNIAFIKDSSKSLNNLYNKIYKMNLTHEEFIKLTEDLVKNSDFQEKIIAFNMIKNDTEEAKKMTEFLKRKREVYNLLKERLSKCESFLKTFFGNQEKKNINEINDKTNLIIKSKNIGKDLNILENYFKNSNIFKKYKDYFRLFDSKFFIALYHDNKSKKNNENKKDLFDKTKKDFLNLVILTDLNEDLNINQIPSRKIIIEEIKNIIKKSKNIKKDKGQECLTKIKDELNIINELNMILNNIQKNNNNADNNEQNLNDIFDKERKLVYLSYYQNIKRVIQSLIFLIDLFNVNKTDIYEKLIGKKNEIDNKDDNICLKDIKNYIKFFKELKGFEIDITFFDKSENDSIFVEFLNILDNNEEEMKFLIGKKNNEIRALSEFIGETENSKIQIADIQDFINICDFFENMKALNVQNDIELIEEFKTAFLTAPSFANSFNNYLNNFKVIKSVYEEFLEKPEMSRNKIEQILKFSNININFDNDSRSFIVEGAYKDIQGQNKTLTYNDLLELNDRALLFCNKIFDKKANDLVMNFEYKKKNSELFIDIVENITQLTNYLFSLYIKGYPFSLNLNIHIDNNIARCNGKEIKILLENCIKLSEDLENEQTKAYSEKSLIRLIFGHQFYDLYNYLFNKKGDIMPLLKRLSNNKINRILFQNDIKNNIRQENNKQEFNYIIDKINSFLIKCLQLNGIKISDLYKNNLIKKDFEKTLSSGFYIWVDDMKLDLNIINVYKTITGNLPLAITILLCNKETNEEEITSFIYRVFLCEYKVLFIIIGPDNLELSKAQYLLWILESIYNKYKKNIKSALLITFTDINSALKKELTKLKGQKYFISSNFIDKNNMKKDLNQNLVEVWSSDAPGVGKSIQIKIEAEKNKKNYIYFPIGGVTSRKDIINRLTQLQINKQYIKQNYFHIDIYDSNEETSLIIKEFLFSLLITRSYLYDEKIFYLEYGVKIVIEIPIGFYDMKDKFVLLDYFPQKRQSIEKLPNLIDLDNKNKNISDIQLIANILIMLENDKIEDNVFDLNEKHKLIPIEQCQSIINKYFILPKGNYYQKIAFIHILADQFRKFCLSFYLNPEILLHNEDINKKKRFRQYKSVNKKKIQHDNIKRLQPIEENDNINQKNIFNNIRQNFKFNEEIHQNNIKVNVNQEKINNDEENNNINDNIIVNNKNEKNENIIYNNLNSKIYDFKITSVRKIMIKNLIKLTLYFIKGPFTKMILNQKGAISQIFGEFNENKINEIANEYLSNADEERISFEKINPSLVFFNEDIQTFSIITTSNKGEEEYEQLLRLYNSQNHEGNEIPLINYRNLTHEEFLSQVKNVLNLNELSIKEIKNIIGTYCFTSDNFIKMILILLRIRAGIPVIMMGETGCGKTSLIKILSALLNRGKMNLKIMNIHAGIKDKDIIDFIEKINQNKDLIFENHKNEKGVNLNTSSDKIWVFFDEINTCNSMGLLSEIFYKHTYYGKKLNKKLTFIAACNPYRLKLIKKSKNEEDDFCLTSKDKKYSYNAKQNLVYHVNPLPHSLLTSIFDFGHLSSQDEKKYIKNIVKETLNKYKTNEEIENLFVEEIFECQNFVREHNDISSVSLRDLRRFNLLFEFFMKYLEERKENNEENKILINSMCLSLYFCYYIRLSKNKLRKELIEKINQKLTNDISFEDIILKEKEFLISNMKIPQGIAKNRTLKENIFVLFVCIINKIPLIMCGKPGTSKSLSFQILYDSMKGERTDNEFLKKYPEILIFSYQGSKTSTSEGVQKVFTKVKNSLKKKKENNQNNLSTIENMNKINFSLNINQSNINNLINNNSNNQISNNIYMQVKTSIKENHIINNFNNGINNNINYPIDIDINEKININTSNKININTNNQINTNTNENQINTNTNENQINNNINNQINTTINENQINTNFNNQINNNIPINAGPKESIIPVVYFDEMGLAEESPHNPLKVIHSELEYDDREQKFGFVGISNWKLDASKMNRVIFLGVPNLEENDLQETASEIAKNLDEQIYLKYKELFSNLVKSYWNYKNFTQTKNQKEFHGLRDFYHLIKTSIFYLLEINDINVAKDINIAEKTYQIGIRSLYRNFDGLREPFNSYEEIKKIFDSFYPSYSTQTPNVFECLKDNIRDNNSRYLLIITKSSMSIHLLKDIMHKMNKKYVFYNGSQLSEDLNLEKYNEKLLNKIQLSLENGDLLVLRNMENIYPSLYNLFNQNFTLLGKKKFSRIAFANYNTYSEVHEEFRAIILVDEKKIEEKMEDPPFLNRFEKHILSFEYLMSGGELEIAKDITEYLEKILSFNKEECKIDLKKQVIWYNSEEIKGLVIKETNKYDKEKE